MQYRKVQDEELIALSEQGLNQAQIAERVGVSAMAISKRMKKIREQNVELPESFMALSDKRKKFVLGLAEGKTQTQAAKDAFDVTTAASAKSLACNLMREPDISTSYADLLASEGLSRRVRVGKMAELLHSRDNAAICKVLDLSFKLDGSMVERVEHHYNAEDLRRLFELIPDKPKIINVTPE
jgi:predicted transcriptional regulator